MFKNLKLGKKIGIGFGLLIIVACSLGGVAIYNMSKVESESTKLASELVPEVDVSNTIQNTSLRVMYAMRGYNLTGDEEYLTKGNANLELLTEALDKADQLTSSSKNLSALAEATRVAQSAAEKYTSLVAEIVDGNSEIKASRERLTTSATAYMENCQAFLGDQRSSLKKAFKSGASPAKLRKGLSRISLANEVVDIVNEIRIATFKSQALRTTKEMEDAQQMFATLDEKFAALKELSNSKSALQKIEATQSAANDYAKAMNNLLVNWKNVQRLTSKQDEVGADIVENAKNSSLAGLKDTGKIADLAVSVLGSASTIMIVGLILAVIIGVFVALYITRSITTPLTNLTEVAKQVGVGDVNQVVGYESKDEIGQLAIVFRQVIDYLKDLVSAADSIANNDLTVKVACASEHDALGNAFQKMVSNLTTVIHQLKGNANELASASTEVSSSSDQMSTGARNQSEQTSQVSAAIEEMTATIVEASKNANDAKELSDNASTLAEGGRSVVAETIDGLREISEASRQSGGIIQELSTASDKIGEIISVIDDIADQTNLLALNAAIEAARAGEQGRGFAVVADEVRKLAERTTTATAEIADMIKGIQEDSKRAVVSMEEAEVLVTKGQELADKAGNTLGEINSHSQQVMDMITQIASATEQQSAAAEQISRNIESISSVTKQTAAGAEQSATAAEEMSRQADGLQTMVANFVVAEN